jgi:hypothetical protein
MLYVIERRRRPVRTLRGWAIAKLQEAGAIRECEYHGWLIDCADPHALERALENARQDVPRDIPAWRAMHETLDVLVGIGDTCPDCSLSE